MKRHKKITAIEFLILLCLLAAAVGFRNQKSQNRLTGEVEGAQTGLVSGEDLRPLPISEKTVKNGRGLAIPILMYHHIGDVPKTADNVRKDLTVSIQNFSDQVKWLASRGYTGISLKNIYLFSQGKYVLPKNPIVFTFDDGYEDVLQNALPILKQYGFTASLAVITRYQGTTQGDNVYASWAEISTAYQNGNEIVSHTQNHFDGSNPKFSPSYIFQNLTGSITDIYQHLGFTTNILVYPYGHYNDGYIAQAQKAGFVMGITVHEGDVVNLDDLMQVPRIRVHGQETLQKFEDIITHGSQVVMPKTPTSTPVSASSQAR